MQYKLAIIGAGPGGMTAFDLANKNNISACLIEANSELGGQPAILFPAKTIYDYPEFKEISGGKLTEYFINKIKDKKDIFLNTTVSKIEQVDEGYKLTTNKEPIFAQYVIVATGGGFFKFNLISGGQYPQSMHYYVKDINLYKDKKVIIAGGGDSALDWALEILKRNLTKDISIVHRRNEFRATGKKVDLVKNSCIKLYLNKTPHVRSNSTLEIEDNETHKIETLRFDYLLVQYGQTYSLQDNGISNLFELDQTNRILVNEACLTSQKNIYAIGNASSFQNKARLIVTAVEDAKKAMADILQNE